MRKKLAKVIIGGEGNLTRADLDNLDDPVSYDSDDDPKHWHNSHNTSGELFNKSGAYRRKLS